MTQDEAEDMHRLATGASPATAPPTVAEQNAAWCEAYARGFDAGKAAPPDCGEAGHADGCCGTLECLPSHQRPTPAWSNTKMNPWKPDDNPYQARRIGKTAEEVGELASVLGRISIQGMDATDPSSGKTNRQRLLDETADVMAQCEVNLWDMLTSAERTYVRARILSKRRQMDEWESHYG